MFLSLGKEDLVTATTAEAVEIAGAEVNALCNEWKEWLWTLVNYAKVHLGRIAVNAVDGVHVLRAGRHHGDHITQRLHSYVVGGI